MVSHSKLIRATDLTICNEACIRILKPLIVSYQEAAFVFAVLLREGSDQGELTSRLGRQYGLSLELASKLASLLVQFFDELSPYDFNVVIEALVENGLEGWQRGVALGYAREFYLDRRVRRSIDRYYP